MIAATVLPILLLSSGCNPQANSPRVLDKLPEPLVGSAERPLAAAPPPVIEKPASPKPASPAPVAAEHGWMPAGGLSGRWRYVIIHHSADDRSTPAGMAAWHRQRGWDELGYHFVVGNGVSCEDGKVYVGSRWSKQKHGAHTRVSAGDDNRWNEHGIGICLIGNFDQHSPTGRQMTALNRLVTYLCEHCHIPPERIRTHGGVDPHTRCPGQHFSLGEVRRRVAAALRPAAIHASSN